MSLVYLARPVDQAGDYPPRLSWWHRESLRISKDLADAHLDVYRPAVAFKAGMCGPEIQDVNRAALGRAAGGVALLPAGVPTLGVPAEIEQMLAAGRPVLIVSDIRQSVQLRDWLDRGAATCGPDRIAEGLAWLAARLAEQDGRGATPPLVFEGANTEPYRGPGEMLPTRGYPGDAGLDLVVSADTEVPPYAFVDVPCGVKVDLPAGTFGLILGRSSTLRKRGLIVSPGVIDEGWTGPLFAGVQNMLGEPDYIKAGERIAQLLLLPALAAGYAPVWGRVPIKNRGERGFGSTGS